MNNQYNNTTEESPSLYAEFARLCGAPKDMDLDGQIMLYEEYQRAIEAEMEEKFKKDTTEAECEKIVDDFIYQWIAKKQAYFTNAKENVTPQAPPEAYAAFVRIYIEWMGKNESEQIEMIERSVRRARTVMDAHSGGMLSGKPGNGKEFLGDQFEEYVNTVWVEFTEKCENPNEFALYLQKDFDKAMKEYEKMRKDFLEKVNGEWTRDIETKNLSGAALDQYFEQELPKREAEFQQLKENFEKRHSGFPKLSTLLRRPAQNKIARRLKEITRESTKEVSLDDDTENQKLPGIKDVPTAGLSMEEKLALEKIFEDAKGKLNEQDQKIFDMKLKGYKQTEIAKELGISDATVSNHVKKIQSMLRLMYGGTATQ